MLYCHTWPMNENTNIKQRQLKINKFKACQSFNIMIFTLHYYFIKSNQDSIFIPYLKTNKIIRSNTHKKISGS
jgi:hypothetical protein